MASNSCSDDEPKMVCPFNDKHLILKSRMAVHITRCKDNTPDFQMCPFNSNHRTKNLTVDLSHQLKITYHFLLPLSTGTLRRVP